nr:hypothetical protein [Natronococcus sp. AD5]
MSLFTWRTAWYVAGGISTTIGFLRTSPRSRSPPVVLVVPLLQLTPLLVVVLSALFLPRRLDALAGASAPQRSSPC